MMKGIRWWFRASLVGILVALAPVARADVVGPPPDDCPEGSEGASCHGGPYCRPIECATDMDCPANTKCKPRSMCTETIFCGGNIPPDADPAPYERTKITLACGPNAACAAGATCKPFMLCVASDPPTAGASGSSGGCACGIGAGAAAGGATFAAGIALAIGGLRRRQGRPSRQRRR